MALHKRTLSRRHDGLAWPGAVLVALAAVLAAVLGARGAEAERKAHPPPPDELPAPYRAWLDEVDVLITAEERDAFLALAKDYQRDAFVTRFWQQRDPFPETARNEMKERYEERVATARSWFELEALARDPRPRHLLLNGVPDDRFEILCRSATQPLEVWYYRQTFRTSEAHPVLFYRPNRVGAWRRWDPFDGRGELFTGAPISEGDRWRCGLEPLFAALRLIAEMNVGRPFHYTQLLAELEEPEPPSSPEWVETFAAYSTDLPADAATFDAALKLAFPGWRQSRTVVEGLIEASVEHLGAADLYGHRSFNLVLNGEVLREDALFESFRYRFDVPAGDVGAAGRLPLVFQRYLRPGAYRLVLRLEDLNGGRLCRLEQVVEVPAVEQDGTRGFADPEVERALAAAHRAVAGGESSIQLVRPYGNLVSGLVRFDTLVLGPVDHVTFSVDGRPVLSKRRPPYSVELDLGALPRSQVLRASARDASGRMLAADEILLNGSPHRFTVRLIDPTPGERYEGSVRVRVDVRVPEGERLERVELYRGDDRVATLYDEPFVQPLLLGDGAEMTLVRAVGVLRDGEAAEDVVMVNGPPLHEEIGVDLVELFTSVVDGDRRPVLGLSADEFRVFEDGREQELRRFERIADLPIHASIVLDVSASMAERLPQARDAALGFVAATVRAGSKDRVAAITFNDRPSVAAPYTNEVSRFAAGIAGVKAERGTALYDSLIYALFYASGLQGHRAILLLSDGVDESSRFAFDEALDFARRSEVAIYAIGLDLGGKEHRDARRVLRRFAAETGGQSFFLESVAALDATYETIRLELRAKYLLAYQSDHDAARDADDGFRRVSVRLATRGLEAKTIRGYYPR